MEELKQSRFGARKPCVRLSIGNRSRRCLSVSLSLSAILSPFSPVLSRRSSRIHSLPTRVWMLFISGSGARRFHESGSTNGFASERIRTLFCVFPCSYLPVRSRARYSRMDPARISQRKHRALPLERSICTRARARGEIISVTRNTPAAAVLLLLGNFLLEHRHVEIMCIPGAYYFGISRGKRGGSTLDAMKITNVE